MFPFTLTTCFFLMIFLFFPSWSHCSVKEVRCGIWGDLCVCGPFSLTWRQFQRGPAARLGVWQAGPGVGTGIWLCGHLAAYLGLGLCQGLGAHP